MTIGGIILVLEILGLIIIQIVNNPLELCDYFDWDVGKNCGRRKSKFWRQIEIVIKY